MKTSIGRSRRSPRVLENAADASVLPTGREARSLTTREPGARTQVRGDIQALRALAVVLVLLNHLWPDKVTGGYIGVDIFFVISGYLITAHLLREVTATGRVRLASFWSRRVKRLLPASLLVLAFSFVITVTVLPVSSTQSVMGQIGAAGTYVLNWLLAASSLNYFASGNEGSPVTHFWSLSVEEQFYLVWPLIILGCVLLARRIASQRVLIASAFLIVFAASLAWSIYSSGSPAAYFDTFGRAWEFAAGGLLAFVPAATKRFPRLLVALAWSAWGVLAAGAILFDSQSGFPGTAALIPVAAALMLLWVGDVDHEWAPTGATSFGPVQFIGGISYSLYLWHWPLIVAAPYLVHREVTARDKIVIVGLVIVLAYLSKRFVEDPLRTSRKPFLARPRTVLLATAAAMVLILTATGAASADVGRRADAISRSLDAQSERAAECFGAQAVLSGATCVDTHTVSDPDSLLLTFDSQNSSLDNGGACQQSREGTQVMTCTFGVVDGTQSLNVALVGDSHAGMWASALGLISEQTDMRVTTYLKSACAPTLDPDVGYVRDPGSDEACRTWREATVSQVADDPAIDVVITSSIDRSYVGPVDSSGHRPIDTGDGYVEAWKTWLAAGKRVIAVNNIPERSENIPACIMQSATYEDPCTMPAKEMSDPGPLQLAAAQMSDTGFSFLDFQSVFCDELLCHSVIGGIPAYLDASHVSAPFARSFSTAFLAEPFLTQ